MITLLSFQSDGWWGHMNGAWGWGMMLFMTLFWIAIIALVVWLIVRLTRGESTFGGGARGDRAEEILRERYARGEIDRETFDRMRDELRRGG